MKISLAVSCARTCDVITTANLTKTTICFEKMILKIRGIATVKLISRNINSKIPTVPIKPPKFQGKIKIDRETILHLERLSLVDFANVEGVKRLEEAIEFAQPIKEVKTEGVEPMYTVLDDATLRLAEDEPEVCSRQDILSNAAKTEEDYFVAPPGNIPLKQDSKRFLKTVQ